MPVGRENAPSCLGEIAGKIEPKIGKISAAGRCHRPPRTLASDFEVSSTVLGSGYAGQVRLAFKKGLDSKQQVAVKSFKLRGMKTSKKTQLTNEIGVFLCMDHPHVARLLDVYETNTEMHLVMECMEGGELFERVRSQGQHSELAAAAITRQVLLALNYMHSRGVVHRDLKLENILFASQDRDDLKLIDFGFSKFRDRFEKMKTDCGTLSYIAPEVLAHDYTSQCDMWSLGVIVFILLSGKMPFYGPDSEQIQNIKVGSFVMRPDVWNRISSQASDFVRSLLELDPNRRLSSNKALAHAWLKQRAPRPNDVKLHPSTVQALCGSVVASKVQLRCRSIVAGMVPHEDQASAARIFKALDADDEGRITLRDLQHALGVFQVPQEEILQVFRALSHDKDEIQYSDFLAAVLGTDIPWRDDVLHITFRRFDPENSGQMSASELWKELGEEGLDAVGIAPGERLTGTITYADFEACVSGGRAARQEQDEKEIDAIQLQPSHSHILDHRHRKPSSLRASVRGLSNDLPVLLPPVPHSAQAARGCCQPFSTAHKGRAQEVAASSDGSNDSVVALGKKAGLLERRQPRQADHACCVAM
mmetsp:Transcript_22472/g.41839  ORF Transcript_22472/g.41839 Transcript_22472/m.41839 type:complete len:590 (-) Transcript_22472:353-2122(-)